MAERNDYAPGTPSWVDISSHDLDATRSFYEQLFGWTSLVGPIEEAGGYGMFQLRGKHVAGSGPAQEGQPTAWTTYISVDDADKTAELVEGAGGAVFVPPMEVLDVGRMAVLADPQGAVFAIWQPRAHRGAELVNEPGALCWNELNTTDPKAAARFYRDAFGWTLQGGDTDEERPYYELMVDGTVVAGMMRLPEEAARHGAPPHWLAYFAVDDCETAIEKVSSLGGTKYVGPMDVEVGRFAVVADPQGAVFGVIKLNDQG